jgi:Peptidase M50B-like
MRKDQKLLLAATGVSLACWLVPGGRYVLAPLEYLNTHLHELGHALAGIATGGSVGDIRVNADFSGTAEVSGGWTVIVASAGYVGTSFFGAFLVFLGRSVEKARAGLMVLAAMLLLSLLAFVRGDLVGILTALFWIATLAVAAKKLPDDWARGGIQFLGIQQCLTSVVSFVSLFLVSLSSGHSDAKIMENLTGIPALLWAFSWFCVSVALIGVGLLASWRLGDRSHSR